MKPITYHHIITFLFLSLVTNHSLSQLNDSLQKAVSQGNPFSGAEIHLSEVNKKPAFPGGKKAWHDFIRSQVNLPVLFSKNPPAGNYPVIVRIIVNSDGKLREIGAVSNVGYGMEAEFIRCIRKSPDWIPAETVNGKKVSFTLHVSVTFKVKTGDIELAF
jgi:hypothetical protein